MPPIDAVSKAEEWSLLMLALSAVTSSLRRGGKHRKRSAHARGAVSQIQGLDAEAVLSDGLRGVSLRQGSPSVMLQEQGMERRNTWNASAVRARGSELRSGR